MKEEGERVKKLGTLTIIFILVGIINSLSKAQAVNGDSIKWAYCTLKRGDKVEALFGNYWIDVLRFNRLDRNHLWPGRKIKVPDNLSEIKNYTPLPIFYEPAQDYKKYVLVVLTEQFLGCYEFGQLKFSFPIASGTKGHPTPTGNFKALARHRDHRSSKYKINESCIPYPMHWGVKFHITESGSGFWIHGRDMPGHPASHGCIGLYDEEMQKKYYHQPQNPVLNDAKKFYIWLFPDTLEDGRLINLENGTPIRIVKNLN